jgi:hypothetical protein
MALYEEQPSMLNYFPTRLLILLTPLVAVNTQPGPRDTFSLRSIQHKDREGKIISK